MSFRAFSIQEWLVGSRRVRTRVLERQMEREQLRWRRTKERGRAGEESSTLPFPEDISRTFRPIALVLRLALTTILGRRYIHRL